MMWPPPGGFTYCAIACFHLANKLSELPNSSLHLRWLVDRQIRPPIPHIDDSSDDEDDMLETASNAAGPLGRDDVAGFQGRSGKDTDACYSFWCTAALKVRLTSRKELGPSVADFSTLTSGSRSCCTVRWTSCSPI